MKRIPKILFLTLGLLGLSLVLSLTTSRNVRAAVSALVTVVNSPAQQPFQQSVGVSISNGSFSSGSVTAFTVPSGKRLILETVEFHTQVPSPEQVIVAEVQMNAAGGQVFFAIPVSFQGTIPVFNGVTSEKKTNYAGLHPASFFADPGTNVEVDFVRSAASEEVTGIFDFAGYVVDVP
jgi:hypothetical protein